MYGAGNRDIGRASVTAGIVNLTGLVSTCFPVRGGPTSVMRRTYLPPTAIQRRERKPNNINTVVNLSIMIIQNLHSRDLINDSQFYRYYRGGITQGVRWTYLH